MKKQLLILTIILSAFSCSDEPTGSLPKGGRWATKEEMKTIHDQEPPVCNKGICCVPAGGGVICFKEKED